MVGIRFCANITDSQEYIINHKERPIGFIGRVRGNDEAKFADSSDWQKLARGTGTLSMLPDAIEAAH